MTETNQTVPAIESTTSISEVPVVTVTQKPRGNKLSLAIVFAALFIGGALIFFGMSLSSEKKGITPLPSPSITETVTPTSYTTTIPTPTLINTVTPTALQTPTVTPTITWTHLDGNFLKIMAGDTTATSIPVSFEIPVGYVVEGFLIKDSCVRQKISNGNPYAGKVGNIILTLEQTCTSTPGLTKLPTSWKDIGTITHLADDGSSIHVVRMPGGTTGRFVYGHVLKSGSQKVTSADFFNTGLTVYTNNKIGDAMGKNAVRVNSVALQLTGLSAADTVYVLEIADRIVLRSYVK